MFVLPTSLLVATALGAPPSRINDLTITEVQPDPNEVAPYYGEWFEIHNNSGGPIELNGLVINRTGQSITLPDAPVITLGASDYFVFGTSAETDPGAASFNGNVEVDYVYDYFTEFNMVASDDAMSLVYDGLVLDSLVWDSSWDFVPNAAHQVQPNALANEWANDLAWNWCSSPSFIPVSGMHGTPGGDNDQCGSEYNRDNDGDGYSEFEGDCDDEHADIHPEAVDGVEAPNGVANDDADCDGIRDDGITDEDGDGYTEVDGDCNDANDEVNPGSAEVANGLDDDCNGCVDDVDVDGDGWTPDPECGVVCDSDDDGDIDANDRLCYDCLEGDATFNPDAADIPYDDLDQDCSGFDECDVDGDGYKATSTAGPGCDGNDCDDTRAEVHPGAIEANGNGLDDDCDGIVDVPDADGDGYTVEGGDCMDVDAETGTGEQVALSPQVNPGAREICFDMLDNDCDGWIDNLATCTRDEAGTRVKGGGLCSTGGAGAASGLVLLGLALAAARRRRA